MPEDLSVVGLDTSELAAYCEVLLTSAVNPTRVVGRKAAEKRVCMMNGDTGRATEELEPELEIRSSVKLLANI